jgi:hypothetical protein
VALQMFARLIELIRDMLTDCKLSRVAAWRLIWEERAKEQR